MITLISRWKLRSGAPAELLAELPRLARAVQAAEPGTLAYSVHLGAPNPLGSACPIPPEKQKEVVFFEIYADAAAFQEHLVGAPFQAFLAGYLKYFKRDRKNPEMPRSKTRFLERESAFFRGEAG